MTGSMNDKKFNQGQATRGMASVKNNNFIFCLINI